MSDLEADVAALEARADDAESNEQWDALGRPLTILRAAAYERLAADRRALEAAEKPREGVLARLNPFGEEAKKRRAAIAAHEQRLEDDAALLARVERLDERYWLDRTSSYQRELVRTAEKIQRQVAGSWETKAAAVAVALLEALDGDEAIARAEALLTNPLADDPRVLIAAGIRGDRLAAAERFLAACDCSGDAALAAAWIASERDVASAAQLVRDLEIDAALVPAAIASNYDQADIEARTFAFADRPTIVQSFALSCGRSVAEIRDVLDARSTIDDDIAAAALFSDRSIDACARCADRLRTVVRGDTTAEGLIRRAAVASARATPECVAIVEGLQQRFSGSWESEATIVAAALLAHPDTRDSARRLLIVR